MLPWRPQYSNACANSDKTGTLPYFGWIGRISCQANWQLLQDLLRPASDKKHLSNSGLKPLPSSIILPYVILNLLFCPPVLLQQNPPRTPVWMQGSAPGSCPGHGSLLGAIRGEWDPVIALDTVSLIRSLTEIRLTGSAAAVESCCEMRAMAKTSRLSVTLRMHCLKTGIPGRRPYRGKFILRSNSWKRSSSCRISKLGSTFR